MPTPFKVVFFGSNNAGATPRQIFKPSPERKVPDRNAFLVNTRHDSIIFPACRALIQVNSNFSCTDCVQGMPCKNVLHMVYSIRCLSQAPRYIVQMVHGSGTLFVLSTVLSFKVGGNFVEVRTIWQES